MKIEYKGIMENVVTFLKSGTVNIGDMVKVTESDTVSVCTAGDVFDGIAVSVGENIVGVQLTGFAELPVTSAPGFGKQVMAVGENGTITTAQTGRECCVVSYDSVVGTATVYFR